MVHNDTRVFMNDGNRYVSELNYDDNDRNLNLYNWNDDWNDNWRFAVVRNFFFSLYNLWRVFLFILFSKLSIPTTKHLTYFICFF